LSGSSAGSWSSLVEQADRGARRDLGVAAKLAVASGHDPQQRRLAGAVVAEHADLGAEHERKRDVLQHLAVRREDLCELVGLEDVFASHRQVSIGPVPVWDVGGFS
jgi:hypothetical protein